MFGRLFSDAKQKVKSVQSDFTYPFRLHVRFGTMGCHETVSYHIQQNFDCQNKSELDSVIRLLRALDESFANDTKVYLMRLSRYDEADELVYEDLGSLVEFFKQHALLKSSTDESMCRVM